ncbi:MAG TPA: hypothetical protein VGG04_02000 [Candidatus Sulfotelmatobacter sp.]
MLTMVMWGNCHVERSGRESEAILPAQSKHPYVRNDSRPATNRHYRGGGRDASTPNVLRFATHVLRSA